jgi:hypothetical protein
MVETKNSKIPFQKKNSEGKIPDGEGRDPK